MSLSTVQPSESPLNSQSSSNCLPGIVKYLYKRNLAFGYILKWIPMHVSEFLCSSGASSVVPCLPILIISGASNSSLCFLNLTEQLFTVQTLFPCATGEKVLTGRNLGKWRNHLDCCPSLKGHSPGLAVGQWLETVASCVLPNFVIFLWCENESWSLFCRGWNWDFPVSFSYVPLIHV